MKSLLIGAGEVGLGIYNVIKTRHEVTVIDAVARDGVETEAEGSYQMLHICFGYNAQNPSQFGESVVNYINRYRPSYVVIHSTVPPGTTRRIQEFFNNVLIVHGPVEGRHQDFATSMHSWNKPLGCVHRQLGTLRLTQVVSYFATVDMPTYLANSPEETELCKIWSTTRLGFDVAFTHYVTESLRAHGVDYQAFATYLENYNELYGALGLQQFTRPVLQPPQGPIGGHCVMPNMRLLKDLSMQMIRLFIEAANAELQARERPPHEREE